VSDDSASKVRRCTTALVKMMVGLSAKWRGRGEDIGRWSPVAHEILFMTSAAAGLQSLATFISLDPAVVDESLDYCMKRTGKRWGDYMGVLGKVADRKVGSVYGGCNLVHLIANALNIEKGITAGEFEECLGLPEGFIGRFPYPRAKVGKLVSGICWLVQAMRPFFYSTCLWSFLFLGWGEFGWVIHRVTFFTVFQEFQFCSISLRMVALLFAKRASPPPSLQASFNTCP
jgi:hypothetical protein